MPPRYHCLKHRSSWAGEHLTLSFVFGVSKRNYIYQVKYLQSEKVLETNRRWGKWLQHQLLATLLLVHALLNLIVHQQPMLLGLFKNVAAPVSDPPKCITTFGGSNMHPSMYLKSLSNIVNNTIHGQI